ncbi:TIGR00366 family protein [Clostridium senegalense]|uniref:TIGR00366 family protein n=1 Tax=Clostridium senegalense TaxID=1465809 RepID=A0A6M0H4W7_9CLOT|nr:TIGR00366 family protein [Clostridium senegalense]NEU05567.1 TIGR00366 family protein [Clostridium senegalense]
MFKKFTNGCVKLVQKYLPDPFIFAAVLTVLVFVLGMILTGQTPVQMVGHWGNGMWTLLAFSMQMALVLVLGHALANAPAFNKLLKKMAKVPKNQFQAIIIVTFISLVACWINWGFGLVIGAIFAKEVASQVKKVDYRLLIASAYSGFLVWHAGLSGSIPLTVASGGEDVKQLTRGVIDKAIPTSETIFNPVMLITLIVLMVTLPLVNRAMHPSENDTVVIDPSLLEDSKEEVASSVAVTPADKIETSPVISILLCILGFSYIIYYFITKGFNLNLDIVNTIFLFTGILLHKTPRNYVAAIGDAAKGSAGIILQFPFYAGITGMMIGANADGASLAGVISTGFVSISTKTTFPIFSFLSAGIVNFFVPSGGGQWAVQAPIMLPAGQALGVPAAITSMSIAWGDAWTNMIQPFWALPALGIAGLGAKDIMGYCLVDLIYSGIIIILGFLLCGFIF